MIKKLFLKLIRFYQHILSPDTGLYHYAFPNTQTCRFSPTCSEYAYRAVNRYGIIKGLFLGFKRILRCHPLSKGGIDPIP